VATTGGHGDLFAPGLRADLAGNPGPEHDVISGPAEAARVVRQHYRDGMDLIKITEDPTDFIPFVLETRHSRFPTTSISTTRAPSAWANR